MGRGKTTAKTTLGPREAFNVRKRQKTAVSTKSLDTGSTDDHDLTLKKKPSSGSGSELRVRKSDEALPAVDPKEARKTVQVPEVKNQHMEYLRQFDLNYEYGPCVGISRIQRWNKAKKHNKAPPEKVKQLVESHKEDPDYAQGLWHTTSI